MLDLVVANSLSQVFVQVTRTSPVFLLTKQAQEVAAPKLERAWIGPPGPAQEAGSLNECRP